MIYISVNIYICIHRYIYIYVFISIYIHIIIKQSYKSASKGIGCSNIIFSSASIGGPIHFLLLPHGRQALPPSAAQLPQKDQLALPDLAPEHTRAYSISLPTLGFQSQKRSDQARGERWDSPKTSSTFGSHWALLGCPGSF